MAVTFKKSVMAIHERILGCLVFVTLTVIRLKKKEANIIFEFSKLRGIPHNSITRRIVCETIFSFFEIPPRHSGASGIISVLPDAEEGRLRHSF